MTNQPSLWQKNFLFLGASVTGALCIGLLLNQFRDKPLPLIYQSKEQRLEHAVKKIESESPYLRENSATAQLPEVLTLEQVREIVEKRQALILDARPEIFYRMGHIPTAVSLPREDFERAYFQLRGKLEPNKRQPIAIYCSGASCEDSHLVKKALLRLGYSNVAVFRGGWSEWVNAGLAEERL